MEHPRLGPPQAKAIRQGVRGEDIARGLLGFLGDLRQDLAVAGAGAILLAAAKAVALQAGDHLVETNLLRAARQLMPAMGPPGLGDQSGATKRHQHLVEEWAGNCLTPGDLATLQRAPAGIAG